MMEAPEQADGLALLGHSYGLGLPTHRDHLPKMQVRRWPGPSSARYRGLPRPHIYA